MADRERNTSDSLWDVGDVAAFLNVSERTVKRRVAEGTIPSFLLGGVRRFDPDDIRAWVEEQKATGSEAPAA